MPFCLQKQLRKQLTGALKPSLLLLRHSCSRTSPPDTALSECRESLDQKSRLPMSLPWQNARSEVRTQSQSLQIDTEELRATQDRNVPDADPEKQQAPSTEGTPELPFFHLWWERPGIPKGTWTEFHSQLSTLKHLKRISSGQKCLYVSLNKSYNTYCIYVL